MFKVEINQKYLMPMIIQRYKNLNEFLVIVSDADER